MNMSVIIKLQNITAKCSACLTITDYYKSLEPQTFEQF